MRTKGIKGNCKIFLPVSSVLLLLMGAGAALILFGFITPSTWSDGAKTIYSLIVSAIAIFCLFIIVLCKHQITERQINEPEENGHHK